jgi:DNA-binding NtrC family response regulator
MMEKTLLDGKKILIVDDEPDVLDSLEELLSMCDVSRASSFEEAEALLKSKRFDLAILDIMGVQGYKLLDLALEKEVISIMLTAHALTPEETVRSYKKGAAFFVPKDRLADIATFLNDVLEAKEKGYHHWARWLDRLGPYYDRRFGSDWKDTDREFWEKLAGQDWRLASVLRKEEERE